MRRKLCPVLALMQKLVQAVKPTLFFFLSSSETESSLARVKNNEKYVKSFGCVHRVVVSRICLRSESIFAEQLVGRARSHETASPTLIEVKFCFLETLVARLVVRSGVRREDCKDFTA